MVKTLAKVDISPFVAAMNKVTEQFASLALTLGGIPPVTEDERCDYSWLYPTECAHCLGHEADWEEKKKVRIYD